MRRIIAVLACAVSFTAQAQLITGAMLMPNPLGVVLSIGQWITFEGDKTYYIEVQGQGRDVNEARLNGFRIAVEQAVGTIVASETEVNNNRITRDEIISYASAYITKYQTVSEEPSNMGAKVTMKVWLKRSTIANRLLNEGSKPAEVDGSNAAVALATLQYERAQGDKLVNTVLNDFYRLGFNFEIKKVTVKLDDTRGGIVETPFVLSWNRDYLKSLWEALKATAQDTSPGVCWNCRPHAALVTIATGGFMGGSGGKLGFSDTAKVNSMLRVMVGTQPRVRMTIYTTQNTTMYVGCHSWDALDHASGYNVQGARYFVDSSFYGPPNVNINGNNDLSGIISIRMNPEQLRQASRVELKVVPVAQCPQT